jgi:hypothetical protein
VKEREGEGEEWGGEAGGDKALPSFLDNDRRGVDSYLNREKISHRGER